MEAGQALQHCVVALARAGFKDVSPNVPAGIVIARKKAFGQWTKSQVTISIRNNQADGTSSVIVIAEASPQSLSSLASDPAQRLVDEAAKAITAA